MRREIVDEFRKIGFYDLVERSGRSFHVQTEVIGTDETSINTTVIESGAIIGANTRGYMITDDNLAKAREVVESQHRSVLRQVRAGKFD